MAHHSDRGRTQFLTVVGAMLLELALLSFGVWLRGGEFHPVTEIGRPLIFTGLAALAFRGALWARKLLAAWSALLALSFGVAAINIGFTSALGAFVALGFAGDAVYAAIVLFTSSAIAAFLAQQRTRGNISRTAV